MKSECLSAVRIPLIAAFALAAFSAQAADMYTGKGGMKDAPAYDPVPNWTGFYFGANGGYAWSAKSSTVNLTVIEGAAAPDPSANFSMQGGFGGGQIGYNLQQDRFVYGIEADFQGAGIQGKRDIEDISVSGRVAGAAEAKSNLGWFGTVRGRLGYTYGSSLLYATGGFAYGGAKDELTLALASLNALDARTDTVNQTKTLTGYTVGGGIETMLTPSWSAKAEYQYIDLGSTSLDHSIDLAHYLRQPAVYDTGIASAKFEHQYHTVRVGLNYRFNQAPEPLK